MGFCCILGAVSSTGWIKKTQFKLLLSGFAYGSCLSACVFRCFEDQHESEWRCQWEVNHTVLLIPEILKLAFYFCLNLLLEAVGNKQHLEGLYRDTTALWKLTPARRQKVMQPEHSFPPGTGTWELKSHSIPCAAPGAGLWFAGFLMNSASWLVLACSGILFFWVYFFVDITIQGR